MREVPNVTRLINYAPLEAEAYFRALAPDFGLVPQTGTNLGERLDNALTHCLTSGGFHKAIIMDSDSPTLPCEYLAQAFALLEMADVVLGPCEDGGYYLIGLKQPTPALTRQVEMSTPHVLEDTLALAASLRLTTALLPTWYDVDTHAELNRLRAELALHPKNVAPATRAYLANLSLES